MEIDQMQEIHGNRKQLIICPVVKLVFVLGIWFYILIHHYVHQVYVIILSGAVLVL